MKCLIVIPARWNSSRLPGKPLIPIAGRTLLSRVVDLARRAIEGEADVDIVVATDDLRIVDHAGELGSRVVMTSPSIASGSGRALAAALVSDPPPCAVVNLQGDAPFVPVDAISGVLQALRAGARVATPVVPLDWAALDRLRAHKRRSPFSGTTCVIASDGRALWFSKSILPAMRDEGALRLTTTVSPVHRHLGVYGYTLDTLKAFEASAPSALEQLEGLEQLRLIELGIRIDTVRLARFPDMIGGIDTADDVRLAESLLHARIEAR